MKRNKGFTLIELLAVIIILGVLAVIVIPVINNSIKNSKEKSYQNQINNILDGAKNYGTSVFLGYDNNIEKKITIEQLQEEGFYEKKDILNPKTGEKLVGCVIYKWVENTKQYEYRFDEACKINPTLVEVITKGPIVATGSGLYKVSDTEYRYRGGCTLQGSSGSYTCSNADPISNYISINGQKYRIISVDSQGVKVMSEKKLSTDMAFDKGAVALSSCNSATCPRNNANNTFCQVVSGTYYGCSVYAAVSGNFISEGKTGTVTQNSTLYDYLNTTNTDAVVFNLRNKALEATWNIGAVTNGIANTPLTTIITQEQATKAKFKLGLINASDYINGSIDAACQTDPLSYNTNSQACRNNNWLFDGTSTYFWTINPYISTRTLYTEKVMYININSGGLGGENASSGDAGVRPAGYLSSGTTISGGNGTSTNPWVIE